MTEVFKYEGNELALFQHAKNWKSYFSDQIKPYIKGDVLEAGAGIGASTLLLNDGSATSWLLLEPDNKMSAELKKKIENGLLPPNSKVITGSIDDVHESFDTIIYIDVLEHIADDKNELKKAQEHLKPGGYVVVLSPAFQFLYNPFDKAIGHHRRYNRRMLRAVTPEKLILKSAAYYDSTGFFAAAANKIFLKKKYPTQKQVLFWDRWLVPISRVIDKIVFHSFGKSILAVWKHSND